MRRRFLRRLAMLAFRGWWIILPLAALATAAAVRSIQNGELDTGLESFLPAEARDVMRTVPPGLVRRLEPVVCRVIAEAPGREADLIEMGARLAGNLDDRRFFQQPILRADPAARSYYESLSDQRLMALLTDADWEDLKRLMSRRISAERMRMLRAYRISSFLPARASSGPDDDPLGALEPLRQRLATSRGPTRLDVKDGYFIDKEGVALTLLLYPLDSAANVRGAQRVTRFLDATRDFALERWAREGRAPLRIEFDGGPVTTALAFRRMTGDLGLVMSIAGPLACLLVLLVFRRLEAIFFILLPPLLGAAWTAGLGASVFTTPSFVSLMLVFVIFMMGLVSAALLYLRLEQELGRERNWYRALRRSYVETGRGLVGSAVVKALLFFFMLAASLMGPSGETGARTAGLAALGGAPQAALVAAAGVVLMLMANLVMLPVLAAVKRRLAGGRVKPVRLPDFALARLYNPAISAPRVTLAVMLLIALVLGSQAGQLDYSPRFTPDAAFFFPPPAADGEPGVAGHPLHGRPLFVVVKGNTLELALQRNDLVHDRLTRMANEFGIQSFDSLRPVLPSLRTQRDAYRRLAGLDIEPFRAALRQAARSVNLGSAVYRPFLESLERLKRLAANPQYIELTSAEGGDFVATVERFVEKDGQGAFHIATPVYPVARGFDQGRLGELERRLAEGMADNAVFAGDPVVERSLGSLVTYNMALTILLSIVAVFVSFAFHFRSLRFGLLTFIPVAVETLWICGAMAMAGISIHFFTVLGMPLALGLAMDNALQTAQYHKDRRPPRVRATMEAMGRGLALTCGLIALLPGALALAAHAGLRDFGAFLLLAALASLTGGTMLQPALLRLFGAGQSLAKAFKLGGRPA